MHEHRQNQTALGGQQLAGLFEQVHPGCGIHCGVGRLQQSVVVRPFPVGFLPFRSLDIGNRQPFARRAHRPGRSKDRLFQPDIIPVAFRRSDHHVDVDPGRAGHFGINLRHPDHARHAFSGIKIELQPVGKARLGEQGLGLLDIRLGGLGHVRRRVGYRHRVISTLFAKAQQHGIDHRLPVDHQFQRLAHLHVVEWRNVDLHRYGHRVRGPGFKQTDRRVILKRRDHCRIDVQHQINLARLQRRDGSDRFLRHRDAQALGLGQAR